MYWEDCNETPWTGRTVTLLLCLWLTGCGTWTAKTASQPGGYPPGSVHAAGAEFHLTLRMQNPNRLPSRPAGSTSPEVAGQQLASGASNQAIDVPALGETEIQVQLHTTLVSWLKQLGKVLQGESQLAYQLEGQLEVCKVWPICRSAAAVNGSCRKQFTDGERPRSRCHRS
jgi:LEA14-like dessication related protein